VHDTPILMLTARDLVTDRVAAAGRRGRRLPRQPFALDELACADLGRCCGAAAPRPRCCTFSRRRAGLQRLPAERGGRRLELTKTELSLLELFLRNPRRVLSRTQIFESVWGYDFGPESNALWVYISYLRSKLEAGGGDR
jgi:two-component system response regulator MprA